MVDASDERSFSIAFFFFRPSTEQRILDLDDRLLLILRLQLLPLVLSSCSFNSRSFILAALNRFRSHIFSLSSLSFSTPPIFFRFPSSDIALRESDRYSAGNFRWTSISSLSHIRDSLSQYAASLLCAGLSPLLDKPVSDSDEYRNLRIFCFSGG